MNSKTTIILGVTASDAHAVRNRLLQLELEELGYHAINLGVCTPLSEFVAAFDSNPSALAIVIGTLNGHAVSDLRGLQEAKNAGLVTCPVILGGNLSVGAEKSQNYVQDLHDIGVDHVLQSVDELFPLLTELAARATHWPATRVAQ